MLYSAQFGLRDRKWPPNQLFGLRTNTYAHSSLLFTLLSFIQQTMHIQVANRLPGRKKERVNQKSSRLFYTDTIFFLFLLLIDNQQQSVSMAFQSVVCLLGKYLSYTVVRVKYSLFNGIRYTHWMRRAAYSLVWPILSPRIMCTCVCVCVY